MIHNNGFMFDIFLTTSFSTCMCLLISETVQLKKEDSVITIINEWDHKSDVATACVRSIVKGYEIDPRKGTMAVTQREEFVKMGNWVANLLLLQARNLLLPEKKLPNQ